MADFSLFGSALPTFDWTKYGQPQSSMPGLTLADLWQPAPRPRYPAPPTPFGSFKDLGPEAKKLLRREAILRIAAALGGDSGQLGSNLARAAGSLSGWKEDQLEQARGRQKEDYALASRQAEFDADQRAQDRKDAQEKIRAQGMLAAVQQIAEEEPDWASRAEALAKAGRYEEIADMLEKIPERKRIRARGGDPDDPLWDDKEKARISREDWEERQRIGKEKGYGTYYDDQLSIEEIEARSAAAARGQRSVWGDRRGMDRDLGRIMDFSDQPYHVRIDPDTGEARMDLVPGAPPPPAKWEKVVDPERGTYFADPATGRTKLPPPPPSPAIPLPETRAYVEQNMGRPLTAAEKNEVEKKWRAGVPRGRIVAEMKAPKPPAKGAPTQGPPPRRPSGPPPPQVRPQSSRPGKVTERDRTELRKRMQTDARFKNLSPEEFEAAYANALRLLGGG